MYEWLLHVYKIKYVESLERKQTMKIRKIKYKKVSGLTMCSFASLYVTFCNIFREIINMHVGLTF